MINLDDRYSVRLVLCSNDETVCDGRGDVVFESDAVLAACEAASKTLLDLTDEIPDWCSNYSDWHGGRHYKARDGFGIVAVHYCVNDLYIHADRVPADLRKRVTEWVDAANKAADAAFDLFLEPRG